MRKKLYSVLLAGIMTVASVGVAFQQSTSVKASALTCEQGFFDNIELLSTETLITEAMKSPQLIDLFSFDEIGDGFDYLEQSSLLFKELFNREDIISKMLEIYTATNDLYDSSTLLDENLDGYLAQVFLEGYLGLHINELSESDINILLDEYVNSRNEIINNTGDSLLSDFFMEGLEESLDKNENLIAVVMKELPPDEPFEEEICSLCNATVKGCFITVAGKNIYAYKWISGGYSQATLSAITKDYEKKHPTYSRVSAASCKYNCHSYAWYSTSTNNCYWIPNPTAVLGKYSLYSGSAVNAPTNSKLVFYKDGELKHSAIKKSKNLCVSKHGHYGVYQTTIAEMQTQYGKTVKTYTK